MKEHETDMPHCWCNPKKEVMPNGNMVIIHDEKSDCCFKNIDKAIRKGRAHYICPVCKKDVTLMYVLYMESKQQDSKPTHQSK